MMRNISRNPFGSLFKKHRHPLPNISALLVVLMLAACIAQEAPQAPPAPELNLDTLEAETAFGILHAERAETSYVAPLGEGQAIGIAFLDTDTESQEIFVLLYDRECVAILQGELDAEGKATLMSEDPTDFEATVELTVADNAASGTVSLVDETRSFSTEIATGISGVYQARGTDENTNVSAEWVVLPDERQWGCVCVPPGFNNPCCKIVRR